MSVAAGASHDIWISGADSPRLMQSIENVDIVVEAKVDAKPQGRCTLNGIVVDGGGGNLLRFEFLSVGTPGKVRLYVASLSANTPNTRYTRDIDAGASMIMRVQRQGNHWTQTYSYDGAQWFAGASFDQAMTVVSVGPHAGNAGEPASPAYAAAIDYFLNSAMAIVPPTPPPTPQTDAPVVNVWYGQRQQIDLAANVQRWVNVLGRVSDPDGVRSLTYSLNGAMEVALTIGPDLRRLEQPGDFNIEMDRTLLHTGINTVVIRAQDAKGNVTVSTVTLECVRTMPPTLPYSVNWGTVTDLSRAATVIDGLWTLEGNSVRTVEVGYDRILGIGDVGWQNYELTAPVTVHRFDPAGFRWPSGSPGFGIVTRWQGHYTWENLKPSYGWWPAGATAWAEYDTNGLCEVSIDDSSPERPAIRWWEFKLETTYIWKVRVQTLGDGRTLYSLKVFEQGTSEPAAWDSSTYGHTGYELSSGSILLVAHHTDVSFGQVTIVPVP